MPDDIRLADLTVTTAEPLVLETGGTATVSQVAYAGKPFIFKRYFDGLREAVRPGELQRMLDWHHRCPAADRARLHIGAAWVRHLVWDGDTLAGVLVPQAPPEFIATAVHGPLVTRQPRTLGDLTQSPPAAGRGLDPDAVRLNALSHLVDAILWFHDRGVVINDLHAHNVLVRPDGDGVYLVDCDSMTGEHWAPVLAYNPAPDAMREVVPGIDQPTVGSDFGRLAQVVVTTMLKDEVAGIATHPGDTVFARLCDLLTESAARFVCATRDGTLGDLDHIAGEWRRLAGLWRRPAWASVRPDARESVQDGWDPIGGPLFPHGGLPRAVLTSPEHALLNLYGPDAEAPRGSPVQRYPPKEFRSGSWTPPPPGPGRRGSLAIGLLLAGIVIAMTGWLLW